MKDWFTKESDYEDRYRRGKVPHDSWSLWKYIPKEKQAFVSRVSIDSDGYWIYLDEGFVAYDGGEDCGIIHEYTISDLKEAARTIRKRTV